MALIVTGALCVTAAQAQVANTTASNDNILNLLSPFLGLNGSAVGQATLTTNLSQALATNNNATLALQQLAISDKSILNNATNTSTTNAVGLTGNYGVAANLAGGLPAQTPINGITPQQPVGGLGAVLGPIYQSGVSGGAAPTTPLLGTVNLLTTAYNNLTSPDLGVAKFYFANGTTNGTTTAVAATGNTLPTANGLPNTTNSVYDLAYGVNNRQTTTNPPQNVYGDSRPVQVAPTQVNQFDPTALNGLSTNPSFPSGHTTYAYTDSILLAMLVPQDYSSMLARASAYANSRIVLGVHYPLDIIASRALASYDLAQGFTNPAYMSVGAAPAAATNTVVNLPTLYNTAEPQIQSYLTTQGQAAGCGATIAACSASAANTANDPYAPSAATQATYVSNLTYGLPTLTFAQAPREAAPAGGPDASILLAPVYGGSTAAALQIAPTGGLNGALQTSTINQILVNTETNALAAFYGTSLSYWTRIDLYSASTYFQNVIGVLSLAPTDVVTTNVTIGNTGVLDVNGTVSGTTVVGSGGALSGSGLLTNSVAVNASGALAAGSLAAQASLLAGNTGVTGTRLTINGPLTFAQGSTFGIVATSSQATNVLVNGTTTINGGTVSVQAPTNGASTSFSNATILTATTGVTGTFAAAATNLPFLAASLSYDANDVFLSVNRSPAALNAAAATPNQLAVAQALSNPARQPTTGPGGTLLNAIFSLGSTQQAQAAFDSLSGEGIVAAENAGIRAARVFTASINDQAISTLTGGGFGAANSITVTEGLPPGVLQYQALAPFPSPIVVDRAPPQRTFRAWASGFGGGVSINGDANVASESGSFYGGVLGLDYRILSNVLIGVAGGGSQSAFSVSTRATSGSVTGAHGGVYSLVDFGPYYAQNSVAVSSFSNTTTRTIAGFGGLATATEKASFGSLDIRTRAEFGRVFDLAAAGSAYGFANLKVTPFVALEIARLQSNGFAEYNANGVGNVFGLSNQGQSTADVPAFLGARVEGAYAVASGVVLRPIASLAYLHEFAPQRTLQNGFLSLPGSTFLVSGARPSSNAVQTKVGFDLDMGHGVGLFANFDGEFSSLESVYAGKGGVRILW